ncbi:CpsD/CapB family tyrosine-protein kinase [Faecalitalea cylindroides]|uniref:CpsD/CapB family tyrosine-protein kinase n=1 Tax=Faecalitalea cylindroides TaxID=39483 RepID=UPI00195A35B6|nr:CpsD/CapB family tyrosine-protein kinase [Faecalitalea cylindroides]MBM6810013.1 CpsD/CapB family tyrosine-protein kinase [Faecalitalea cylindroides]
MKKVDSTKNKSQQFDEMEVYRHLRTNIEYSSVDKKIHVINITSTQPGEGKTTTSTNLSIVSSGQYGRVLLVDCDMRKPQVHKRFNISNRFGLSNVLAGDNVNIPDSYFSKFKDKDTEGVLYVLPAGVKVPNPTELLSSEKFKEFVECMRMRFEFIILDCPPVLSVSDCIPVSRVSDGTLFVVSSKDTDKNDAKTALQQLQRNGANVIGTVLNKVDKTNESSYYSYY